VPKIIKVGGNLTKLWQKQFGTVFLRHGVEVKCLSWRLKQNKMHSKTVIRLLYSFKGNGNYQYNCLASDIRVTFRHNEISIKTNNETCAEGVT